VGPSRSRRSLAPSPPAGILVLLGIALALVIVSYVITYSRVGAKPGDRMGASDWKFTESWASTLTASGGILGTVLAGQVLPAVTREEIAAKTSFVVFHLMFAAIVVVAAALYNTFRFQNRVVQPPGGTPKAGETPRIEPPQQAAPTVYQYQGYVICFLIASALVLWAVLGQLFTVWRLLGEVLSPSDPIYGIFTILLGLAVVLALIYGATSVPWTLRNQAYRDEIGSGADKDQAERTRSNWYLI
jgi:flagellar basal body-associated protein FliL